MGLPESIDTNLNWTEVKWTELQISLISKMRRRPATDRGGGAPADGRSPRGPRRRPEGRRWGGRGHTAGWHASCAGRAPAAACCSPAAPGAPCTACCSPSGPDTPHAQFYFFIFYFLNTFAIPWEIGAGPALHAPLKKCFFCFFYTFAVPMGISSMGNSGRSCTACTFNKNTFAVPTGISSMGNSGRSCTAHFFSLQFLYYYYFLFFKHVCCLMGNSGSLSPRKASCNRVALLNPN